MKSFKQSVAGLSVISVFVAGVSTSALAMGPSRPQALEGVYELTEPCTGWPEMSVCCGPGELWTDLPLPLAGHLYDKTKDGRPGGYRPFPVGTQLRIETSEGELRLVPITAQGEAAATVLTGKSSRSRKVKYSKKGFSVRDRFSVPATGMSFRFDIFRHFEFSKLDDGSLEVRYRNTYFTRAEPSVCHLDKISN